MLTINGLMESNYIKEEGLKKEYGTISTINIKYIKNDNKKDFHKFMGLGVFMDLMLNDEITKITCVWLLTPNQNKLPEIFSPYQTKINPINPIREILSTFDVKEINALIGIKVKIIRTSTNIRIKLDEKIKSDDKGFYKGAWIFPDLFQFDDIKSLIMWERLDDLYRVFPEHKDKLYDMKNELLKSIPSKCCDSDKEPKKHDIVSLLEAVNNIEENAFRALNKLGDDCPEAEEELAKVSNKLHKAFLKIDVGNINIE